MINDPATLEPLFDDPILTSVADDSALGSFGGLLDTDEDLQDHPDSTVVTNLDDYPIVIHNYSLPPDAEPSEALAGDEVHYDESSDEDVSVTNSVDEVAPVLTTSNSARRSSRRPVKKRRLDSDDEDGDDEIEVENSAPAAKRSKKVVTFLSGKKKLYNSGPFVDPEMEKQRMNAINAKKNRDRKKKEKMSMQNELTKLKTENSGLKRVANKMKSRADTAEAELLRLQEVLKANNLGELLKPKGNAA